MSNILANNINPRSGNKITIGNVNTTVAFAGTATYEDVTSIDSVGIITARSGVNVTGGQLNVGSNIKIGNAGVITATSFSGDGSALTGIAGTANVSTNTLSVSGVSTFNEDIKLRAGKDIFFFDSSEQSTGRIFAGSPPGVYMSATRGILNFSNQSTTGTNAGQIKLNCHSSNSIEQQVGGTTKLQVNGSGIDVTGIVTATGLAVNGNNYPTAGPLSNRNLIINGAMQVAQRGTSTSSVTSSGYHAVDRFHADLNAVGTWTFSQSSSSPNEFANSANSYKLFCTGAKASPDAGTVLIFNQRLEGFDLNSLKKGTSAAESVTLSFWVRSTKTGTYIAELRDNDNSRAISKTYSISSADTWEYKTITFPGDTTGAFDNDNGLSLYINWWLAAGSNFTSGTLSTSWASITNANRAVGVVNLADNEDNNWYITGVQLEVGEKATPFEHRSFGDELARCQRYYQRITSQTVNARMAIGGNGSVAGCYPTAYLPTTMRAQPSVSYSAASDFTNEGIAGGGTQTVSSISFNAASSHAVTINSTASGGNSSSTGAQVLSNNTNAHLAFHAEL